VASNIGFLAINTVDEGGVRSYRQIFSYTSLLFALVSILMGMTLRRPRQLSDRSLYSKFPMFIYPIVFCQYSVILLLAALIGNTWQAGPGPFYLAGFVVQMFGFMTCYWWVTIPHSKV